MTWLVLHPFHPFHPFHPLRAMDEMDEMVGPTILSISSIARNG